MEVIKLLDELENLVEDSTRVPLTGKVMLDADLVLEIVDRVRSVLPEEMRQAQWINKERERVFKDAQSQANLILEEAEAKAAGLAEESEIVKKAQLRAQEMLTEARQNAQELKTAAYGYALQTVEDLEQKLEQTLKVIQEGKKSLQVKPENNVEVRANTTQSEKRYA